MIPRAAILLRAVNKRSAEERTLRDPEDSVVIGRGSGATWRMDEPLLSRQHARISWRNQSLEAVDLGSRNGTRINGVPLRAPTRLVPGDRLEVGTLTVTFEPLSTEAEVTVGRPAVVEGTQVTLAAPRLWSRRRWAGGGGAVLLALAFVGLAIRQTDSEPPRKERAASPSRPAPTPRTTEVTSSPPRDDPAVPTGELRRRAFAAYAAERHRQAAQLFRQLRARQPDDPVVAVVLSRIAR